MIDEAVRLLSKKFTLAFVAQGVVYIKDGKGGSSSANLVSLLEQAVGITDDGKLLDEVHRHVSTMLYALEAREGAVAKTFAEVKSKLTVRLFPEANRGQMQGSVTREDLAGSLTVLVLDDEGAFITVDVKDARRLGRRAGNRLQAGHREREQAQGRRQDATARKLRPGLSRSTGSRRRTTPPGSRSVF